MCGLQRRGGQCPESNSLIPSCDTHQTTQILPYDQGVDYTELKEGRQATLSKYIYLPPPWLRNRPTGVRTDPARMFVNTFFGAMKPKGNESDSLLRTEFRSM